MRQAGADGPTFDPMIQAGPHSAPSSRMRPTDRVLESGDMILIDGGARFQGYSADSAREGCYGPVSAEAKRLLLALEEPHVKLSALPPIEQPLRYQDSEAI